MFLTHSATFNTNHTNMNMTRIALTTAFVACVCIPANAALPTITKPAVKVTRPTVTQNEDGTVTIKKGDVKVEKPELKLPEAKKPEFKKPTIEKPSITTEGDTIRIKKGSIKLK